MGNTILLADKSITIQKIVQLTFADDNYQIHCVSDGQAALEAIPRVRPDLILADISLPLKNGYEICSTIRNDSQYDEFSSVPVILLAGIYETMDEERARQVEERVKDVQATDFLSKPFDPQLLINKVKQYIPGTSVSASPTASMFVPEADTAINLFDSENIEVSSQPTDDNEKTMMLPGGPFGNMFAESLPQDQEVHLEEPKPAVDVEKVVPVGEVIFAEEEFPPVELGSDEYDQPTVNLSQPPEDLGQAFSGREEQEFEYSGADLALPQENSVPLVLPEADEPFTDVFQEANSAMPWAPPSASEEDSPFGLPEPLLTPEPEPVLEPAPEFVESPIFEEPVSAGESLESSHGEAGFDDTWPGVPMKLNAAQPVEELFEMEASSAAIVEDVEELEPDLSESMAVETENEISVGPGPVQNQAASSAQFTDEVIDRIAEKVLNKLSERVVSEIVWQVVPDLAEKMIRRELERPNSGSPLRREQRPRP